MAHPSMIRTWPRYRLTTPLRAVGWLYVLTGTMMVLAPAGMVTYGAAAAAVAGLTALGIACVVAGVSLLRCMPWAWAYTTLLAASGVVVIAIRFAVGTPWNAIGPALVTNVLVLMVLALAYRAADPPAGG